jgi:uncharacterized protein YcbX
MMDGVRITRLSTTPIKGLALDHPDAVELTPTGAAGDRDFFLVDERDRMVSISKTGKLVSLRASWDAAAGVLAVRAPGGPEWTGRVHRGEPINADFYGSHVVAGHLAEGPWSEALSALAGKSLRLVLAAEPGSGSDEHPVTLLGEASVAELARHAGVDDVDARRFRMLVHFDGAPPHAEDGWEGQTLRLGDAVLRVGGPVPRCAGTTRHPEAGDRDLPTVRLIKANRGLTANEFGMGVNFGVYADVVTPGTVRVGDELRLGPTGATAVA